MITQHSMALDDDILRMEPLVKQKPKILSLEETTLLSISKGSALNQITVSYFQSTLYKVTKDFGQTLVPDNNAKIHVEVFTI